MTILSNHAVARARQRGLREQDIEFILRFGTDTGDGVILAVKDTQKIIFTAKRMIDMAERLKNARVVAHSGEVITVFHATRRQQHKLLHS
jgi:hypothetical protein